MMSLSSLPPHLFQNITNVYPSILLLFTVITVYLVVVWNVRFRSITKLPERFGTTPAEFRNMDYKDAQLITNNLYFLEAPWMFLLGQYFAVFRAFGLTPVSKLSQNMIKNTPLRFSNTFALSAEWLVNPLDSERNMTSINRVNDIHSRYEGIENDPLLFTLCCLMCQPVEWMDKFEYRQTVPLERYACYVFWKEVGIRLGIMKSSIPSSFEGCVQFLKEYAEKEMRPNEYGAKVAQGVIEMYQATVPKFLRPLFTNIFIYMVQENAREAFGLKLDTQSPIIGPLTTRIFPLALKLRVNFIRYCLLPRTRPPTAFAPSHDGEHMHATIWQMMPYYVEATWWNRWGPLAFCRRVFGLPIPGKRWMSGGYRLEKIGFAGRGGDKVVETVHQAEKGGCPFSTFGRVENEQDIGGVYAKSTTSSGDKSS